MDPGFWSPDLANKACLFAAQAHAGQVMTDSNRPYLAHLAMVAGEVALALAQESGLDGNLAMQSAWLHDVVEDTDVSEGQIMCAFGREVAAAVSALTKNSNLPKPERLPDSLRRIQQQPREAALVKMADRITNLQPPPESWSREKIEEYRQEAQLILESLAGASAFLANRLKNKIEGYAPQELYPLTGNHRIQYDDIGRFSDIHHEVRKVMLVLARQEKIPQSRSSPPSDFDREVWASILHVYYALAKGKDPEQKLEYLARIDLIKAIMAVVKKHQEAGATIRDVCAALEYVYSWREDWLCDLLNKARGIQAIPLKIK